MAIANQGLGEKWIGKIGGVVFQKNKDQVIVKSYQPVVRNPQTPKQIEQRSKIGFMTMLYRKISGMCVNSFNEYTQRLSCFNVFTQQNINLIEGGTEVDGGYLDPAKSPGIKVAKGTLRIPDGRYNEIDNVNKEIVITVTEVAPNENANTTDMLQVIAFTNNTSDVYLFPNIKSRAQLMQNNEVRIKVPDAMDLSNFQMGRLRLYAYFQSLDKKKNSDSVCWFYV